MFGLIKNHPFHDANKRTAFLSTLYFLQKSKRCPTVTKSEFEDFTVAIAEGTLFKKKSRYVALQKKSDDPEIRYIAHFLRTHTRDIDKKTYIVTYRELKAILNRFNFDMVSANGNYIDVVRYEEEKNLLKRALHGRTTRAVKVAQVGFPGWTKEVNKGAIATVRRETRLTPEHGYDSQTFYKGIDDMRTLLNSYQDALRRLAYR